MGSSETGLIARMVVTPETQFDGDVVPLGYPVFGKQIMILDGEGRPAPNGVVGEIAIRSRYISKGYWRQPDLTAKVFRPDPDDNGTSIYLMGDLGRMTPEGCLEYSGRRDQQVKIRGYRVELSEVEAALHSQAAVEEAAVVAGQSAMGEKKLVAYVVLRPDYSPAVISSLRSTLSATLPDYMVPALILTVPRLPRTDNGKLDVAALPVAGRDRPALSTPYVAPRTALESDLASLWAGLLELDRVGVQDNFLELGGHSLIAMQLVTRILNRFALDLSPRLLFETSTVEGQARLIGEKLPVEDAGAMEKLVSRIERLSEEQAQGLLREGRTE
jgi:hypothetical protein